MAYEVREHYKGKTRDVWSYGGAANKATGWNVSGLKLKAEEGAKVAPIPIETLVRKSKSYQDYYKLSMTQEDNRWTVSNPEGVIGHFQHADGLYRATLDGGDADRNREVTRQCVEYIKRHPQWHLSLQTHKLINIQ